jgi:signal transduction histidine kinase
MNDHQERMPVSEPVSQVRRSITQIAPARREDGSPSRDVSHAVRAHLHSILGWTQLLKQGDLDGPAKSKGLDVIERNALAQAELIEALFDLSLLLDRRTTLAPAPVELSLVVARVVERCEDLARQKHVLLTSLIAAPVVVSGTAVRIEQIIETLTHNAVHRSGPRGKVHLKAERRGKLGLLSVSGTGQAGRAEFTFLERPTFDAGTAGVDVGLFFVKCIVDLLGGTIWGDAKGERGATISVALPLHESSMP